MPWGYNTRNIPYRAITNVSRACWALRPACTFSRATRGIRDSDRRVQKGSHIDYGWNPYICHWTITYHPSSVIFIMSAPQTIDYIPFDSYALAVFSDNRTNLCLVGEWCSRLFYDIPAVLSCLGSCILSTVTSMEILVSEYDNCAFARQWCCMTMPLPWIRRYNFHAQLLSLLSFTFGMNRLSGSGRLLYAFDSWYVPWSHRKGFNGACQRYYFS